MNNGVFNVTTLSDGSGGMKGSKNRSKLSHFIVVKSLRAITWKSFSTVFQVLLNSIEVVIGLPAQKQNRQPLPQQGKK